MQLQTIQNELGLPFEFTRLARSSGNVLQLENSLEDRGDDLGDQLRTQSPGQNITTYVIIVGTRMIDRRGFCKCTLLDGHKNRHGSRKCENLHSCSHSQCQRRPNHQHRSKPNLRSHWLWPHGRHPGWAGQS